jgi:hypothetical protein
MPLHVASLAAGVPAWQLSTTAPAIHDVEPVEAHEPTPHDVLNET